MIKHSQQPNTSPQSGFALAWAAVLTILAGMASVTLVTIIQNQQNAGIVVNTQENIDKVIGIIIAFERNNHSLPCPASLTEPMDNANYGLSRGPNNLAIAGVCDNSGGADGTHTIPVAVGGNWLRIGAFPNRTLGLADQYTQDKWGNRLLYAVSEELLNPFTYTTGNGVVTIKDSSGVLITDAAFIVVSQGDDMEGAYSNVQGILVRGCTGLTDEENENCDNDDEFMLEEYDF